MLGVTSCCGDHGHLSPPVTVITIKQEDSTIRDKFALFCLFVVTMETKNLQKICVCICMCVLIVGKRVQLNSRVRIQQCSWRWVCQ